MMRNSNLIFLSAAIALLSGCLGGGGGKSAVQPDGNSSANEPPDSKSEVPKVSQSNLVVKVGGKVIAYYLDGDQSVGRFMLADTGYVVAVDMWTGELRNSDQLYIGYESSNNCSGGATLVAMNGRYAFNQIVVVDGSYYRVTGRRGDISILSRSGTIDFDGSIMGSNGCVDPVAMNYGTHFDYSFDYEAVSSSELPSFPSPVEVEVQE